MLGHSQGCVLTVQMAASELGAELLGLEIAGTGCELQPRAAAILAARSPARVPARVRARVLGGPRRGTGIEMRDLVWGPGHLYPPGAARTVGLTSSTPPYEVDDVRGWADDLPALAPRVRVPVHYSLGQHERVWRSGPPALAEIAALFTASPRVAADEQAGAGHMLSRGLSAVAYHLKVLSFAEECALARGISAAGRRESPGAAAVTQLAGG